MDSLWKKKEGNTPSYYYQEDMRWGDEEHMTGVQPMNATLLEYWRSDTKIQESLEIIHRHGGPKSPAPVVCGACTSIYVQAMVVPPYGDLQWVTSLNNPFPLSVGRTCDLLLANGIMQMWEDSHSLASVTSYKTVLEDWIKKCSCCFEEASYCIMRGPNSRRKKQTLANS